MRPSIVRPLALALVATLAGAAPLAAQGSAPLSRRSLAINPLGVPFGWFSGEIEGAIGGGASFGVSGSFLDPDDEDDSLSSIEAKLRYYPAEQGLRGFSIGLTGGYTRLVERYQTFSPGTVFGPNAPAPTPTTVRRVTDGPTVGVAADYNWLLGARRRMIVGLGVGAKRIFTDRDDDRQFEDNVFDLPAYPTARFVVGLTF
jgi:hypothetical protein